MRVIVAGCRDYNNFSFVEERLNYYLAQIMENVTIISGHCPEGGVDKLGEMYANKYDLPLVLYKADWSQGRRAGPIRNEKMAQNADILIAFWDGKSKGTKNMIEHAINYKLKYRIVMIPEVRRFWIDVHYACYGIVSKKDIVTQAPPIAKWMIGKTLKEIKPFLLEKKAIVKEF